ncbi:MAG TPA: hypothetical protein VGM23_14250 [Armatimonadota bacterium]|jgi:hypothetical protein
MLCWVALALGSALCVLGAGCTAGGELSFDPTDPGGALPPALPTHFAGTQGNHGWYYYQAPSGTQSYQTLVWEAAPAGTPYSITQCWGSGASTGALIAREKLCPGQAIDAVIAWHVPTSGLIQVNITLQAAHIDAAGDGVAVSIWQNAQRITEPVIVPNNGQSQTITTMRTMQGGDTIYIRLDPQEIGGDWYNYSASIEQS